LSFCAGRVDGRVQTAEAGHCLIDQIADFVVITDVRLDEGGFGAEAAELGFEGFVFRVPAAGDARALLGEGDSGGSTDAGQAPSNQDNRRVHESLSWFSMPDTQGMAGERESRPAATGFSA